MNSTWLIKFVRDTVYSILDDEKLLIGEWHLGKIESVIDERFVRVFVDGSETAQKIPYNPDLELDANDEVWVHFVNRDSRDKFVTGKRAV